MNGTEVLIKLDEHFNRTLDPKDVGGDLEPDEPPLTIMWLLDGKHFVPLIPPVVKKKEDSGLGESALNKSEEGNTTLEEVREGGDSGLGESLTDKATEVDTSPCSTSTPRKKKDELSKESFKPTLSSTPKKTPKEKASDIYMIDITSDDNIDKVMEKLEALCDVNYNIKTKLCQEKLSNETLRSLTGPYKMADHKVLGIVKDGTVMFITKLIEVQFQIKWKTDDGKPERFNFYEFCDVEKHPAAKTGDKKAKGKTVHLKYDPRKAHVFTELYREASAIDMKKEVFCPNKPKEEFCPDVYVRGKDGWVRICFRSKTCKDVNDFEETFSWMHESLRTFVANADKVTLPSKKEVNYFQLVTAAIEKPTLYWAVLEDTDFRSGDHLKLREIGKTQVYVGKANGGIMMRWIKASNSHSGKMRKCADHICRMDSFDASRLDRIQLVDARLLLAKIKKEKNAVFLIRTFENTKVLEDGEKQHREGKIIGKKNRNIVPYNHIKDTWTPKKMEFGMNKT